MHYVQSGFGIIARLALKMINKDNTTNEENGLYKTLNLRDPNDQYHLHQRMEDYASFAEALQKKEKYWDCNFLIDVNSDLSLSFLADIPIVWGDKVDPVTGDDFLKITNKNALTALEKKLGIREDENELPDEVKKNRALFKELLKQDPGIKDKLKKLEENFPGYFSEEEKQKSRDKLLNVELIKLFGHMNAYMRITMPASLSTFMAYYSEIMSLITQSHKEAAQITKEALDKNNYIPNEQSHSDNFYYQGNIKDTYDLLYAKRRYFENYREIQELSDNSELIVTVDPSNHDDLFVLPKLTDEILEHPALVDEITNRFNDAIIENSVSQPTTDEPGYPSTFIKNRDTFLKPGVRTIFKIPLGTIQPDPEKKAKKEELNQALEEIIENYPDTYLTIIRVSDLLDQEKNTVLETLVEAAHETLNFVAEVVEKLKKIKTSHNKIHELWHNTPIGAQKYKEIYKNCLVTVNTATIVTYNQETESLELKEDSISLDIPIGKLYSNINSYNSDKAIHATEAAIKKAMKENGNNQEEEFAHIKIDKNNHSLKIIFYDPSILENEKFMKVFLASMAENLNKKNFKGTKDIKQKQKKADNKLKQEREQNPNKWWQIFSTNKLGIINHHEPSTWDRKGGTYKTQP